jgi:hypothetical protein
MMTTVAPGRGSPELSTTVPVTVAFCALATTTQHSANNVVKILFIVAFSVLDVERSDGMQKKSRREYDGFKRSSFNDSVSI